MRRPRGQATELAELASSESEQPSMVDCRKRSLDAFVLRPSFDRPPNERKRPAPKTKHFGAGHGWSEAGRNAAPGEGMSTVTERLRRVRGTQGTVRMQTTA